MMAIAVAATLLIAAPATAQPRMQDELAAAEAAMNAKDVPATIRHLTAACDLGSAEACEVLASAVPKTDAARAVGFHEKACGAGSMAGCHNAAVAYNSGADVPKDTGRAVSLFEKGCSGGLFPSCVGAARLLATGDGVPPNKARAGTLYEKACDGGSAIACSAGGVLYASDDTVRDEQHALRLYDKGCAAKNGDACDLAGILVERQGLVLDRNAAIGEIKTTVRSLCNTTTATGCAGSKPIPKEDRPAPRSPQQIAAAKLLALNYFEKALAINPNDATAQKEAAAAR